MTWLDIAEQPPESKDFGDYQAQVAFAHVFAVLVGAAIAAAIAMLVIAILHRRLPGTRKSCS